MKIKPVTKKGELPSAFEPSGPMAALQTSRSGVTFEQQQELDNSIIDSQLEKTHSILGIQLRELSGASIAILTQIKFPFILGISPAEVENRFLWCGRFLAIQNAEYTTEQVVKEFAYNPEELDAFAYRLLDFIPAVDAIGLSDHVISFINEQLSTRVKPIPKTEGSENESSSVSGNE